MRPVFEPALIGTSVEATGARAMRSSSGEGEKTLHIHTLSQEVKVLDVFLEKNKKYLADGERRPRIGLRAINSEREPLRIL
jgi:hypothetical protein